MNIYQLFVRTFGNKNTEPLFDGDKSQNGCGTFHNINDNALESLRTLGITHIWLTGVIRHSSLTSYPELGIKSTHPSITKGKAGSPYSIMDYYDIDPDLAVNPNNRMEEFEELIARIHGKGMKVIMDFIPNHLAREYKSLCKPYDVEDFGEYDNRNVAFAKDNNFYYCPGQEFVVPFQQEADEGLGYKECPAKASGNDVFSQHPSVNDWYDTVKLNYGVDYQNGMTKRFDSIPNTWFKMLNIMQYWCEKGVDGFRVDMAEMVPFQFWGWVIPIVKEKYPHIIFIAEVYNTWEYYNYVKHGKFDYLYDKVGLYDTLIGVIRHQQSATDITRCWQNLGELRRHMLHFMENHDEQRLASDFIVGHGRPALPAMLVSATIDTCPTMVYFGQELGERGMDAEGFSGRDGRTTIFDYWSVDTLRRWHDGGTFSGKDLNEGERDLQSYYSSLLHIARDEKAIAEGDFFDLMYMNPHTADFNPHRQYAFLRKHENELLLIVANFDEQDAQVAVNIPIHAFDYFGLPTLESAEATELLTGTNLTVTLDAETPVRLTVPGWSGAIIKFTLPGSK